MDRVALGFCARTGFAVAVAITEQDRGGSTLLGRWSVDLTDDLVPDQVFHAARGREPTAAVRYVEEAIQVVRRVAAQRVTELIRDLPGTGAIGVVTGDRELSTTVPAALASHPLMHAAEGELYRDALVDAAAERGLVVTSLPRGVADERLSTPGRVAQAVARLGGQAGPPWRKDHKRAAAAALAALDGVTL